MLRKTDYYNQIPEHLIPREPKKGEVIMYELVVDKSAVEKDKTQGNVLPLPSCVWIPCTSTCYDAKNNEYIPIALIKGILKGGEVDFHRRELRPNVDGVYVTITYGSSSANNDLYYYMELASFVGADGKETPSNTPLMFRKVEPDKEANRKREDRKIRKQAMDIAEAYDTLELNRAALLLGFYSSTTDESIIRDKVEEFAEKYPEKFFERVVNDKHGTTKATILHAMQVGVVKIQDNAFVWADSKAAICTLSSNTDPEIQFANWVHESPENLKTFGIIEAAIKKAEKRPKKS